MFRLIHISVTLAETSFLTLERAPTLWTDNFAIKIVYIVVIVAK